MSEVVHLVMSAAMIQTWEPDDLGTDADVCFVLAAISEQWLLQ